MRTSTDQHKAARIAGAAYFLLIITSILSMSVGPYALIVKGDNWATFANLAANLTVLRLNAAYDLAMFFSVVLLAWALYVVLRPVHRDLALLALLWRVGEAVIGCMTVALASVVILLASGNGLPALFGPARLAAATGILLTAKDGVLNILMPFLCVGTAVNCYLFYRSRYIPRALSVWGMASCLLMTAGAFVKIIAPESAGVLQMIASGPVILFEIVIGLRLWTRGIRIPETTHA